MTYTYLTGDGDYALLDILDLECPNSPGNYRRHPDKNKWYSECNRMSRDQATPLLIVMGDFNLQNKLKYFFLAHLKRGLLFTTNTRRNGATKENHGTEYAPGKFRNYNWKVPDFTGPTFWALYIRGLRIKTLYPLLCVFDLFLILDSLFERVSKSNDVSNLWMLLDYGKNKMPTPMSLIAHKITDFKSIQKKLDNYWEPIDEPPINEIIKQRRNK